MVWKIDISESSGRDELLLTSKERDWLVQAIVDDDAEQIITELQSSDPVRRARLVNGRLDVPRGDPQHLRHLRRQKLILVGGCYMTRPWCLAGAYGSVQTLRAFLQFNVDVCQKDHGGSNILHAMINMAATFPQRQEEEVEEEVEERLVTTYRRLKELLSTERLRSLLLEENDLGMRPLELAVFQGCFCLFKAYFETDGVYLVRREERGLFQVEYFDVTDYEAPTNRRRGMSPLTAAVYLDRKCTQRPSTAAFFRSDLIRSWESAKLRSTCPSILLWLLLQLGLVVNFAAYDFGGGFSDAGKIRSYLSALNQSNTTITTTSSSSSSFLADYPCWVSHMRIIDTRFYTFVTGVYTACYVLCLLYDIVKYVRLPMLRRISMQAKGRCLLVNTLFYYVVKTAFFISLAINAFFTLPGNVKDFMYILAVFSGLWSIFFFFQVMPRFGFFIITIQHMVTEMVRFCFLLLFFLVPLAMCMNRLVVQNVRGPCPREFSDPSVSLYSAFNVLFSTVSFLDLDLDRPFAVYLFHAVFMLLCCILLLNFIIAMFTNTAAFVQENEAAIRFVQRISLIMTCESRITYLFPSLLHRLYKRAFIYDEQAQRFYISRVQLRNKKMT